MEDKKRKVLDSYSESEIEEAFLASFAEKAAYNYINSYEIEVDRDYDDGGQMKVSVEIGSMAGAPTKAEFDSVEGMQEFEITFVTGEKTVVELSEVVDYNAMEYHAIYTEKDGALDVVEKDDEEEEKEQTTLSGSE